MVLETDSAQQRRKSQVIGRVVPEQISDNAGLEDMGATFQGFFGRMIGVADKVAEVDFAREKHQIAIENQEQSLKAARDFDLGSVDETMMDDWDYAQVIERKDQDRDVTEQHTAGIAFGLTPTSEVKDLDGKNYTYARAATGAMAERDAGKLQAAFRKQLVGQADPAAFAAKFYEDEVGNGIGNDLYDAAHRQKFFSGIEGDIKTQGRQNVKNSLNQMQSEVANSIGVMIRQTEGMDAGSFFQSVELVKPNFGGDVMAARTWVVNQVIGTALEAGQNGDPKAVHRALQFLEKEPLGPNGETLGDMMPGLRDQAISDLNTNWHSSWTKQGHDAIQGYSQQLAVLGGGFPSAGKQKKLGDLITQIKRGEAQFGMGPKFDALMTKATTEMGEMAVLVADINTITAVPGTGDPSKVFNMPEDRFKASFDAIVSQFPDWQTNPEQSAALGAMLQSSPRVPSGFRKALTTSMKAGNVNSFRMLQVAMERGTGNLTALVDTGGAQMYHLFRQAESMGQDVTKLSERISDDPDFMNKFADFTIAKAYQGVNGNNEADREKNFFQDVRGETGLDSDAYISPSVKSEIKDQLRLYMYMTGNDYETAKGAIGGMMKSTMDVYPSGGRQKVSLRINGWEGPTLSGEGINPDTQKTESFMDNWEEDRDAHLVESFGFDEDEINLHPVLRSKRGPHGGLINSSVYSIQDDQGEPFTFSPGDTLRNSDIVLSDDPQAAQEQVAKLLPSDRFSIRKIDQQFVGGHEGPPLFEIFYKPGFKGSMADADTRIRAKDYERFHSQKHLKGDPKLDAARTRRQMAKVTPGRKPRQKKPKAHELY